MSIDKMNSPLSSPISSAGAGGIAGLGNATGNVSGRDPVGGTQISVGGLAFKEALANATKAGGNAAAAALGAPLQPQAATQANSQSPNQSIKFSMHAIERMRSRGIQFSPDEMASISRAVEKAAGKGSKDTLVLAGDSALIVSVKNNTVVTVMDKAAMKENVFTNIDSTVVI